MNALSASHPRRLYLREAGLHRVRDTRDLHDYVTNPPRQLSRKQQRKSQDGKFEILFPIALPDEGLESHGPWACDVAKDGGWCWSHTHITPHHPAGTFDWLDDFLENHPGYTEVSVPLLQLVGIQAHTTKSNHSA